MRTPQLRTLALALTAVAAAALTAIFAPAQMMPRAMPPPPRTPAMQNPRAIPAANPGTSAMGAGQFGHHPFQMMMQHPGMQGQSGMGMGMMGPYGAGMMGSPYGAQVGGPQMGDYGAGPGQDTLSRVLTAVGLPNEGGQLEWPVGLRALREAEDLRQQIDALVHQASEQAQAGPANAQLADELGRSRVALRNLLRRDQEERFSLPLVAYEDAERFLTKLARAEKRLRAGLESAGAKAQLEARDLGAGQVGISDNRFDPPTLTVAAGSTVHWTNHGQHTHTITSDKGDWGSKELGAGDVYSYTFSQPGTYPYHCEEHPKEMRGTIVVK
jgi:plastocyanin